jgi:hypothetical protein
MHAKDENFGSLCEKCNPMVSGIVDVNLPNVEVSVYLLKNHSWNMNLALKFGLNVSNMSMHMGCSTEFIEDKKYGACSM